MEEYNMYEYVIVDREKVLSLADENAITIVAM